MRVFPLLMILAACAQPAAAPASPETNAPSAPAPAETATDGPRVIFPDGFVVRVDVAADDELRAQGLMYRDHLRPGTGMLFFFAQDGEHSFWMKNTRIPLDMIWIGADRKIVGIRRNVPPCEIPDCPSYSPGPVRSRYVLEVAAGVAAQHGLKVGDVLRFEQTEDVVVR